MNLCREMDSSTPMASSALVSATITAVEVAQVVFESFVITSDP